MANPITLEGIADCLGIFGVAAEPYPVDEDGLNRPMASVVWPTVCR